MKEVPIESSLLVTSEVNRLKFESPHSFNQTGQNENKN